MEKEEAVRLKEGEAVEDLLRGRLRIIQSREGYRFSVDALLLARFTSIRRGDKVADLGTGSGVIPLLLAIRHPGLSVTGIEIDPEAADRARRSIRLNGLEGEITLVEGDLRRVRDFLAPEGFSLAVANPPYGTPGSGRLSEGEGRAVARHAISGSLEDFLSAAAYLLRYGGRAALIYPSRRLADVIAAMRGAGIEPKRLRLVHSRTGEPARLLLIEGIKGGGVEMKVEPPLVLYEEDGGATAELKALCGEEEGGD